MPNTGKSTFFNRLTGGNARVANWPGVTVGLLSAKIDLDGESVEVIDLPGIDSIRTVGEDSPAVRGLLERESLNLLVVVLHAAQLDRQLLLALELKDLKLPLIVLLNMADEAKRLGIRVNTSRLSQALGAPVRMLSAKYGDGYDEAVGAIAMLMRNSGSARRADTGWFDGCASCGGMCPVHPAATSPGAATAPDAQLDGIVASAVSMPPTLPEGWTASLDRVLLDSRLGIPIFLVAMFMLFELVYGVGMPIQGWLAWLLGAMRRGLVAPWIASLPAPARSFLLDGVFDGVGTVLSFLPIIVVFFIVMAVVEDSGYLARAAFLMDATMARLGLDGRGFVIQLMGFGCNVPAVLSARVIRSRAMRMLTMLITPLALCSARLQVFVFLTAAIFSRRAAPLVLLSLYVISFAAAALTALIWRGRYSASEPMLLELPPYRLPTLRYVLIQSWQASRHFLQRASGFIVAGVVAVWFLAHLPAHVAPAGPATMAGHLANWLAPAFRPLGINQLLSVTLLFGFVAKEIVIGALAVIYQAGETNLAGVLAKNLDWAQAYSFMLFTLIYTPCLSTVAALRQESGSWRFTIFAVGWSVSLAWIVSFVFYQTTLLFH